MIKKTKIGIWMDHSVANLMDYPATPILTRTIECNFTSKAKEEALTRGESTMHTKEQGEQADYYRELSDLIRKYDEVLLFGPTEAKTELYNTFKDNHLFVYFGETDHVIPWQTDHLNCWRTIAADAIGMVSKVMICNSHYLI